MARSATSITKYKSAVTIVTADVANSWYGGLYGSAEAAGLPANDPLVAGHVHDGQHIDGHAQKIDLVNHVTNQLRNVNLGTGAVDKRTVNKFVTQGDAIPEYEIIGGITYYYLDLSILRSEIASGTSPFEHDSSSNTIRYNISAGPSYTTTDFVTNSPTLDYDASAPARLFFDVSKAAFRVGTTSGTSWDDASRGAGSFGWGSDTIAAGSISFSGGSGNSVDSTSTASSVLNGISNSVSASNLAAIVNGISNSVSASNLAAIVAGVGNTIDSSESSLIGSGATNSIEFSSIYSTIVGGSSNRIGSQTTSKQAAYSFIGNGQTNVIEDHWSAIVSGSSNTINDNAQRSFIGAGQLNTIGDATNSCDHSAIVSGGSNTVNSKWSFIGSGAGNSIEDHWSAIVSGSSNTINDNAQKSFIGAGDSNTIGDATNSCDHSAIVSGQSNTVNSEWSFIGSGSFNSISNLSNYSLVVGGGGATSPEGNTITGSSSYSVIVGGTGNSLNDNYVFVGGGESNVIEKNDGAANHSIILGGASNQINAGINDTRSATHSIVVAGESNTINDASWASIAGGSNNWIQSGTFRGLDYAQIRNGKFNRINFAGYGSNVGGFAGRGYLYNQFVLSGGYFDTDGDGNPSPFGQAQTSILVAAGTVTAHDSTTTLYLDQPAANNELLVPIDSAVVARLTWVARSSDSPTALASAGTRAILLKRELGAATVVEQSSASNLSSEFSAGVTLTPGLLGAVSIEAVTGGNSTPPIRITVKIEWTEVYLEN